MAPRGSRPLRPASPVKRGEAPSAAVAATAAEPPVMAEQNMQSLLESTKAVTLAMELKGQLEKVQSELKDARERLKGMETHVSALPDKNFVYLAGFTILGGVAALLAIANSWEGIFQHIPKGK